MRQRNDELDLAAGLRSDLIGEHILQNDTKFDLDEHDEIYEDLDAGEALTLTVSTTAIPEN
ncbi:MAG: hypothetical protein ACLS5R_07245 [Blautia sp.]